MNLFFIYFFPLFHSSSKPCPSHMGNMPYTLEGIQPAEERDAAVPDFPSLPSIRFTTVEITVNHSQDSDPQIQRPVWGSNCGPPGQEIGALPTELPCSVTRTLRRLTL